MDTISVRFPDKLLEILEDEAAEIEFSFRGEYIGGFAA